MEIVYSQHAQKRMKQRGITNLQVEFILRHPDYMVKKPSQGKTEVVGHLEGRTIKIVYADKENYIKIVTII